MPIKKENRDQEEKMALAELEERLLKFFRANQKEMFAIDELPEKIEFSPFFENFGRYEKEHFIIEAILGLERKAKIRSEYFRYKTYYGLRSKEE
jgi:hypothetical protein